MSKNNKLNTNDIEENNSSESTETKKHFTYDTLDSLLLEESERKNICDITNKKVKELCSKYSIYSEAY